ncbi:hypothetical protein I7I50_07975 [Histoplasma capsulatum G186AR]|uniref:Uncharacterized protein n=1 Tax=Ajellomyces capsulatus TaxID=5037 RepID=A0A8H8CVH7_AJECA|nr:hypothetical protein I7I52_08491 [Histoplasma capsulatum]QSS68532.1 hypothetical protein I7I50_07975 [Histoplasma capsulatum G186AR]
MLHIGSNLDSRQDSLPYFASTLGSYCNSTGRTKQAVVEAYQHASSTVCERYWRAMTFPLLVLSTI